VDAQNPRGFDALGIGGRARRVFYARVSKEHGVLEQVDAQLLSCIINAPEQIQDHFSLGD
jgi:hypothetical protein